MNNDTISRQEAIEALHTRFRDGFDEDKWWNSTHVLAAIEGLPSTQPEIIRCRECKFASGDSRICMKFGHSPIGELDFCAWAVRREVNNESD